MHETDRDALPAVEDNRSRGDTEGRHRRRREHGMRMPVIARSSVAAAVLALPVSWPVPAAAAGPPPAGAPAAAPGTSPLDCPGTRSVPGGYRLTRDTECSVEWREDDAVLDLAGHTLTGRITPYGNRQTVRNGSLVLEPEYWANAVGLTLSGLRITRTPTGSSSFYVEMGSDSLVEDCVVSGMPGAALSYYFGRGGTVRDSVFLDNGRGISVQAGGGIRIESNSFRRNTVGVNLWNERGSLIDVTIRGNVLRDNSFSGVRMVLRGDGGAPYRFRDVHVQENRFVGNGAAGLYAQSRCVGQDSAACADAGGTQIRRNLFLGNGHSPPEGSDDGTDDGLTARGVRNDTVPEPQALAEILVAGNTALRNADLGLDADGVLDGGGNRARDNGDPAQCTGVVCGSGSPGTPAAGTGTPVPGGPGTAGRAGTAGQVRAGPPQDGTDQYRH